uniref:Chitin-binding type-2 domain-containing protein n=1 Tax=Strigamia maritima TaxID=126957 RepID=T1J0R2_STRMM
MKVAIVVTLSLAFVVFGKVVKRQAETYNLPDGAELVVGSIKSTFSCAGRIYGYYADTDNNCQIFHICVHHSDPENGIDETVQFSFYCGNLTVFDQANLVCAHVDNDDTTPCDQAQALYDEVNRNFGVVVYSRFFPITKMKVAIVVILSLALVVFGRVVKRQASSYNLPADAELIVGAIKSTFSCAGRIYGYYADTDNNCQVFHICVHHSDPENGVDETVQYSFFCGNQTVFDQANLVCTNFDDATPCSQAQSLYDEVNRNFGITDRPAG